MSVTLKQRTLKENNVKCPTCQGALRIYSKGLICSQNHHYEKESETWLDTEALVTGIARERCFQCDAFLNKCRCEKIPSGFMLRTRKLDLK